jgi:hypothetical protein
MRQGQPAMGRTPGAVRGCRGTGSPSGMTAHPSTRILLQKRLIGRTRMSDRPKWLQYALDFVFDILPTLATIGVAVVLLLRQQVYYDGV